ncbi:hypothetical protein BZG36_04622 [Bifiguratus adelaidae]|uniref:enoyl-[acyl-carrier-protein] reductase n=1 Tax=Bifiguratus adelaidae TaxID=1938954 RepID=A0A261XXA6_9FUNG|nr:hypothetical protein BZG36_04622 [Bifiguratus adelaidae]
MTSLRILPRLVSSRQGNAPAHSFVNARLSARLFSTTVKRDTAVKAIGYTQYGKPSEILRLHEYTLPELKANKVHIRFLAFPINPADINQIEGTYPTKPPFLTKEIGSSEGFCVAGNEGLAEVVAVGNDVSNIKKGDWVVMAGAGFGTWRSFAECSPCDIQVIPKDIVSPIQAATLTVNPCTAYRMLKDFGRLEEGDFVIQNGANSGVGLMTIQLAKKWGYRTINVVRDRPNLDDLKDHLYKLGATHVVTDTEFGKQTTKEQIKKWKGDSKIKLGLNCVGGKAATEMAKYLSPNGHYVTYGAMSKQPLTLPASLLIFKNLHFHGFWVSRWAETHSKSMRYEMLKDIMDMMHAGEIKEMETECIPWDTKQAGSESVVLNAAEKGITGYSSKGKQVILLK